MVIIIPILSLIISLSVALCIHQYRKYQHRKTVYGDTVNIDDIKDNETVLVARCLNWAWGYQDEGLAINKNGQAKKFDFSSAHDKDGITKEELIGRLDKILEDDGIPFVEDEITLPAGILDKIVSIEDYKLKLKRTFFSYPYPAPDGRTFIFYSVYGSGNDRKLVEMREYMDDDVWYKCNDREINGFCKELGDYVHKVLMGWPEGVR